MMQLAFVIGRPCRRRSGGTGCRAGPPGADALAGARLHRRHRRRRRHLQQLVDHRPDRLVGAVHRLDQLGDVVHVGVVAPAAARTIRRAASRCETEQREVVVEARQSTDGEGAAGELAPLGGLGCVGPTRWSSPMWSSSAFSTPSVDTRRPPIQGYAPSPLSRRRTRFRGRSPGSAGCGRSRSSRRRRRPSGQGVLHLAQLLGGGHARHAAGLERDGVGGASGDDVADAVAQALEPRRDADHLGCGVQQREARWAGRGSPVRRGRTGAGSGSAASRRAA